MVSFYIEGNTKLNGELEIPCSKNAYLPILAACILCKEEIVLHKCPNYSDIDSMCAVLKKLGAKIEKVDNNLKINCKQIRCKTISQNLSSSIRSSIFCLGSILGRCKKAHIAYPGGCAIGERPIDIHIAGLKKLGVNIVEDKNFLICDAKKLVGNTIELNFPSVGATENIMLASVYATGQTIIKGCAKEPEIVDLANFLNKMGAKISGAGSNIIKIDGVKKLKGIEYTPIPDRIFAGTILIAGAVCRGDITLKNFILGHNEDLIKKLKKTGCIIDINNDKIKLSSNRELKCVEFIETQPFPGFPTDLQPQMMVLQNVSYGTSIITENLFESRFKHVDELVKMGAKCFAVGKKAVIEGVTKLAGTTLECKDLRGGAALMIAAMFAEGKSQINNIKFIDRGYENLDKIFNQLGAKIQRITCEDTKL